MRGVVEDLKTRCMRILYSTLKNCTTIQRTRSQGIVWRDFSKFEGTKKFYYGRHAKSALNRQLTAGSDLNECAVYVCQPYACFKLAEVVADMLRKSISRVNHVLTHIAPAPPLVVT